MNTYKEVVTRKIKQVFNMLNARTVKFLNIRYILHLDVPSSYPILFQLKASNAQEPVQQDWFLSLEQCRRYQKS